MEVATLPQLKVLLNENHLFRDYFNTFLNLPIFSRRVKYDPVSKSFDIFPRLHQSFENDVNDDAVMEWVQANRLPFFWSSLFFLQYSLHMELIKGSDAKVNDGGLSEMIQFRQAIRGTEGEVLCQLWMDIQQLLQRQLVFGLSSNILIQFTTHIHHHYTRNGVPFHCEIRNLLGKEIDIISQAGNKLNAGYLSVLKDVQRMIVSRLRNYWCKMYGGAEWKKKLLVSSRKVVMNIKKTTFKGKLQTSLPDIVNSQADLPHSGCLMKTSNSVKLPKIHTEDKMRSPQNLIPSNTNLLFTPSTIDLFPLSLATISTTSSSPSPEFYHLNPFLTGSLRADFLAGHPLLTHLSYNTEAVNSLLFWWSVELLFTMDEMKRGGSELDKHRMENKYQFYYFTHTIPIAKTPQELVELYIIEGAPHSIELSSQVRDELVRLLPRGLGLSLLLSVQEYSAQQLVGPWKEFLTDDNQIFIDHCVKEKLADNEDNISISPSSKDKGITMIQKIYYGEESCEEMWQSLRHAEAIWCPATSLLSSRTPPPPTDSSTNKNFSDGEESIPHTTDQTLRLSDLIGMSLPLSLTTVSNTMRRSYSRSVNTITFINTPLQDKDSDSTNQKDLQKTKKKPKPRSLREVLGDQEQLIQFREFLVMKKGESEVPLLFWLAVEDLDSDEPTSVGCARKIERIVQHFICDPDTRKFLKCPKYLMISGGSGPTYSELVVLQSVVEEMMERQWFDSYLASITAVEDTHKKTEEESEEVEQEQIKKAAICVEHTRNLWKMFAQGVISFRRGLMNQKVAEEFKRYLREEVIRGSSGNHKKLVGTKVVYVAKLLNDLSFWAEVERYKDVADAIRMAKRGWSHSQEDDIMIHKKAHAIINCFIDSAVVPRVQINIPNELVHYILDSASQGHITRGLFHEAALSIFSILILYWRRYLMIRHTYKTVEGGVSQASHAHQPHPTPLIQPEPTTPMALQKVANLDPLPTEFTNHTDVGPILAFSLASGMRWVFHSHRHHFDIGPPSVLFPALSSSSSHHSSLRPGSNRQSGAPGHIVRHIARKPSSRVLGRRDCSSRAAGGGGMRSQLSPLTPLSTTSASDQQTSAALSDNYYY